ncbi:hypothetical protein GIB67_016694 [Kingdonia uniflora]|uniref:HAT C-terminal dimerisation domain-containing protein n=1 Tax=Kingdonia uniflora TaxID=39325 RepID=A0A7J7LMB7_9MAGN|nr:hypothetical protein GIB67_016694 [Kingdonia uniflora]
MSSNVAEGSQGSTGRYRPANSTDPGWDYGQPVDGNRDHVKCDFCGHVSKGGIKWLKQHLVKASYKWTLYKDIRKCDKVPQYVDLLRSFMEGKQNATKEKQNKKDEMIRYVNVYGNDDDEVEEVGIQIPKKRKGPMDAFVAPIDVDFRPRAPTSNENKKALENIHGYIADFFYENNISFNCARSDSYSKMMQVIAQYNDPSNVIRMVDTEEKPYMAYIYSAIEDCKLKVKTNLGDQNGDNRELWKKMEKILNRRWFVEWWTTFGSEVPALQRFAKRVLGLTSAASPCEGIWSTFDNIHTKKRNCLEHDRMRDLAYIQYNKRLKKRYEERISGKEIDPIVLKFPDECAKWLVLDDARDDIVLGTNITYGVLEDAEDGFDNPPLAPTSRTNTASHCSQGGE